MGEVDRTFLPIRMAQRYVEMLAKKGKDAADTWWKEYKWFPTTDEMKKMQEHIINLTKKK